jgi:enoyl-CoA hydratase/carnithine racemase
MELLVTGRPLSADRAFQIGLVNQVVAGADLRRAAQDLALAFAANAPLSVRAGKAMVYASVGLAREEAWAQAEALFEKAYLSEDAQEGPQAFREGRAPKWLGR